MSLRTNLDQPIDIPFIQPEEGSSASFYMEKQKMSNWCWAASTIAVQRYYNNGNILTQQELVAKVLNRPICAVNPNLGNCNSTADMKVALASVYLLNTLYDYPLSEADLLQIQPARNPVACQMNIPSIGNHIVVITAALASPGSGLMLTVADPSDAAILSMPYRQFQSNFRGTGGYWLRTYTTQQNK